jgi:hypothetical protein
MREKLRDKTRDNLAEQLNAIGINATLSERDRTEEKVGNRLFRRSLGIIDITDDGLIKWINIIKQDRQKDSPPRWWIYLGVPGDMQLPKSRSVNIRTKRKNPFHFSEKLSASPGKDKIATTGLQRNFRTTSKLTTLPRA